MQGTGTHFEEKLQKPQIIIENLIHGWYALHKGIRRIPNHAEGVS